MTKLQRITGKTFGETATVTGEDPQIGQFGSAKVGTYVGTTDVATIQNLAAWSNGFIDSVTPSTQFPPLPEMTGALKVLSHQENYLLQSGIPEWDSGTTYYENNFCRVNSKIYYSLQDNNTNKNPSNETSYWKEFAPSARNIGEIVASTIPLTDAGLHLLDGSLISGSGSYSDFVDKIGDIYDAQPKYSNITTVGTLTDNNGVLSGFSASNFAKTPIKINLNSANTWEIVTKQNISSVGSINDGYMGILGGAYNVNYYISTSNKIYVELSSNGTSYNIGSIPMLNAVTLNTDFYLKLEFTGTAYNLYYSTDGETWTLQGSITSSTKVSNRSNYFALGVDEAGNHTNWQGSIDLNECYININGSRWWSGRMASGFTEESAWQTAVTTYGVCGKFVYDSVNNTVRLPKITGIIEGTIDTTALGDLVQAGLPNITGFFQGGRSGGETGYVAPSGAFSRGLGRDTYQGGGGDMYDMTFDASRSSSIYGNSSTVQPQTIKVLYYIVVATTTKTSIEVDIDEIATDLNGKADVDLTNLNNAGKIAIVHNSMPSDTYDDLTIGASGATYSAPADGYFCAYATSGEATWKNIQLENTTSGDIRSVSANGAGWPQACFVSASKGDSITYIYQLASGSFTTHRLRFHYAQGSESEAS